MSSRGATGTAVWCLRVFVLIFLAGSSAPLQAFIFLILCQLLFSSRPLQSSPMAHPWSSASPFVLKVTSIHGLNYDFNTVMSQFTSETSHLSCSSFPHCQMSMGQPTQRTHHQLKHHDQNSKFITSFHSSTSFLLVGPFSHLPRFSVRVPLIFLLIETISVILALLSSHQLLLLSLQDTFWICPFSSTLTLLVWSNSFLHHTQNSAFFFFFFLASGITCYKCSNLYLTSHN